MFKVADFVKETTDGAAEALTGVFTLDGVPSAQFQDFVSGIGDGNDTIFEVTDGNKSETWEGTVADGAPDTLTGTRWLGSTTGSQINWGAGVKTIICGPSAPDYLRLPGAADETELTIASGSVTPTRAQHAIDTESDAGTDDLTHASTASVRDGHLWFVRAVNAARTVVVKDAAGGAGQIHLADGADFSLDDTDKWLLLIRRGADWYEVTRSFGADAAAARAFIGLATVEQAEAEAGTATTPRAWTAERVAQANAARNQYLCYQEQRASGTSGPTYSAGAWRTAPLNTEVFDTGNHGSLASDQVTLAAGTYEFTGYVPARAPSATLTTARARLQNITDTLTVAQGPNVSEASASTAGTLLCCVSGRFTIAASKVFQLEVYVSANSAACPALTTGDPEVYSHIEFKKVA